MIVDVSIGYQARTSSWEHILNTPTSRLTAHGYEEGRFHTQYGGSNTSCCGWRYKEQRRLQCGGFDKCD
jgi:hypothetical protein